MYLLHATRFQLEQFFDDRVPPYAILSHTWESEEPRFQDVGTDGVKLLHGYKKIEFAARQAALNGLEWVWIDTICIDKTSSADLSEAINSMFRWYANSQVCYAYLEDVENQADFAESRWFTRGWTLQELLAPKRVVFYNKGWENLGNKNDSALGATICMACGISKTDQRVLRCFQPAKWSVASRMSWASARITTRREDIAYCLLGIFNINMPLLYGEGDRAFFRLQEEIMRVSDDRSLFAWIDEDIVDDSATDILARSPVQFAHTRNFEHGGDFEPLRARSQDPCLVTSRGISLETSLVPFGQDKNTYYAFIGYEEKSRNSHGRPAIVVRRVFGNVFVRLYANTLPTIQMPKAGRESYRQKLMFPQNSKFYRPYLKSESVMKSDAFMVDGYLLQNDGIKLLHHDGFRFTSVPVESFRPHGWLVRRLHSPNKTWKYKFVCPGLPRIPGISELRVTSTGISLSGFEVDLPSQGLHDNKLLFDDIGSIEEESPHFSSQHCLRVRYRDESSGLKEIVARVVERKVPSPPASHESRDVGVHRKGRFYSIQLRSQSINPLPGLPKLLRYSASIAFAMTLCTYLVAFLDQFFVAAGFTASTPPTWPTYLSIVIISFLPVAYSLTRIIFHRMGTAFRSLWSDSHFYARYNSFVIYAPIVVMFCSLCTGLLAVSSYQRTVFLYEMANVSQIRLQT